MSDESPILPQGKASVSGLIIMLGIATLIPAAFIGGYILSDYLGQDSASKPVEDVVVEPIEEEPIVQDGKPDNSEPEPVPASERIIVDGIGWYPAQDQVVVETSAYESWLGVFLATTEGNAFLKKYGLGTISAQTTRLGLVETGEFAGYELREQSIYGGELGGQSVIFHTLAKLNNNGYAEGEVYIKGSQHGLDGMNSNVIYQELFSESEVTALAASYPYSWFTLVDREIPELAWGYDEIEVDGNIYYYTDRREYLRGQDNEENTYSVLVGKTADGHELYRKDNSVATPGALVDGTASALAVTKKDGYRLLYELKMPLWSDDQTTEQALIPLVTINDKAVTQSYAKSAIGGCGFTGMVQMVRQEDIPGLYAAGYVTSSPTEKIYLANFGDKSFDDEFENWKRLRPDSEATREQFALTIPAFYYKDVIGRWLRFDSLSIVPAGECGKPVIYLYPEETTDVSVQLDPQGGFTVTEPAYNDGWNVTAEPNGQLVNRADGLSYPYLFWEGRGGLYSEPEKYWVVAKADVESFLVEKLTAFGFNTQEIADFNEFWLPRMEAAPWYKIGFHGTQVMDQIAPMSISPAPDSVLRVLMDYSELQEPIAENAPSNIPSFKRNGFTVTEWGGVIR